MQNYIGGNYHQSQARRNLRDLDSTETDIEDRVFGGSVAIPSRDQRYKEQAVDEVLVKKMYETLFDYDAMTEKHATPPTLILVSGDGAASEYSPQGFLKPVKIALNRGWNVEIVAFGKFTSQTWFTEEHRSMLDRREEGKGGCVRVIELENWAEELLA
jgi:hypothetical protein